jgi:hypothetical protein
MTKNVNKRLGKWLVYRTKIDRNRNARYFKSLVHIEVGGEVEGARHEGRNAKFGVRSEEKKRKCSAISASSSERIERS